MQQKNDDYLRLEKSFKTIQKLEKRIELLEHNNKSETVAVIGIGCSFPRDIENPYDFLHMLETGKQSISDIPEHRWNIEKYNSKLFERIYCRKGGFLNEIFHFDPSFFNISPLEAEYMDPQQRLFLENCWKAFEDAGYTRDRLENTKCGVFGGIVSNDYYNLLDNIPHIPEAYEVIGNYNSMLAARIAYFLNLKGPALTVDTACSSSAVAIHLACKSLQSGESDIALAGGVTLYVTPRPYLLMSESLMLSKQGICYAFDERADGFVPGEGCGVVVLKRLTDAQKDNDHIYGIIRGSGINQDGKTNGITAPNGLSQSELQTKVWNECGITAEDITYIEAHGTGTKLGDPIEIEALTNSFQKYTNKTEYCGIGSLKPGIGHLQAASGVASLIKVLLSMESKKIFPILNFSYANKHMDLKKSPFYINSKVQEWKTHNNKPRIAAINSFGFSGTNVHFIVEEYQQENHKKLKGGTYLIPLSAVSVKVLKKYAVNLSEFLVMNQMKVKDTEWMGQKIKNIIAKYANVRPEEIEDDLEYDSIGFEAHTLNKIVNALNRELSVSLSMDELIHSNNLKDLIDIIISKDSSKSEEAFLSELAYTLQTGRNQLRKRIVFFVSSIKELLEQLNLFIHDKFDLDKYSISGENNFIKEQWINGEHVDWKKIYIEKNIPNYISAPVYPFDKKEYILQPQASKTSNLQVSSIGHSYEFTINGMEKDFGGHKVKGRDIIPATMFIELMLEAGNMDNEVNCINNLFIKHPLYITNEKQNIVINAVQKYMPISMECNVKDISGNCTYCEGLLVKKKNEQPLKKSENIPIIKSYNQKQWYDFVKKYFFEYGDNFQLVCEVKVAEGEVHAKILSEISKKDESNSYISNPFLLDAVIQPVIGLMELEGLNNVMFLPYFIKEICFFKKVTTNIITSCIRKNNFDETGNFSFDFDVYDEHGALVFACKDLRLKVIEHDNKEGNEDFMLINGGDESVSVKKNHALNESAVKEVNQANQFTSIIHYLKNAIFLVTKVPIDEIEINRSFPEMGIDSFISLKLIKQLENDLGKIPKTILFEYFTIEKLAKYLDKNYRDKLPKIFDSEIYIEEPKESRISNPKSNETDLRNAGLLVLETEIDKLESEEKYYYNLRDKYEMEGQAYARKEIAPFIFLGSNRESYFYVALRDGMALAFFYFGKTGGHNELANEFTLYCFKENKRPYFILEETLRDEINGRELGYITIGAMQRLRFLPGELNGKKYRHLRYAISHFENSGICRFVEYEINKDSSIDKEIIILIDEWCSGKAMVNSYIYKLREQMFNKEFSSNYRCFLTYLDNNLVNVIILAPMSKEKGYLMDLEFYATTMPHGGLEYSIFNIYQTMMAEGTSLLSMGASFGAIEEFENNTDAIWEKTLNELKNHGVFKGEGNYRFKNKFRTDNSPLKLYRFLDCNKDELTDVIMFIANPILSSESASCSICENEAKNKAENKADVEDNILIKPYQLEEYYYNTTLIPPEKVKYDLLTDSLSETMVLNDNSYMEYENGVFTDVQLHEILQEYIPHSYIVPVVTGRYAESLLFGVIPKKQGVIAQNKLFPTTIMNQIVNEFKIVDISLDEADMFQSSEVFKGNADINKLKRAIAESHISYVVIEMENNFTGGSPVSLDNLRMVRNLCDEYDIPLIIDATRIIENAIFLIELNMSDKSPLEVVKEILRFGDFITASLTKDFRTPVGGFIATNNVKVYNQLIDKISIQGSGLNRLDKKSIYYSLRDTNKIIKGVMERKALVNRLGNGIRDFFPIVYPFGGHCLLIDTEQMKELDGFAFPAQSLLNWLYIQAGVRGGIHVGGVDNLNMPSRFVRLAVPVGFCEKDINEIIRMICSLSEKKKIYSDLILLQHDSKDLGYNKCKYKLSENNGGTNEIPERQIDMEVKADRENASLVAIVGISGQYPEAENMLEFWRNLKSSKDCIREIPEERWPYELFYDANRLKEGKNPCKWGGFLKDIDKFDSSFFHITPYEAQRMDPQQRLFLQASWKVIEDAGYALSDFRDKTEGKVGVFVGTTWSEYGYFADGDIGFYPEVNPGSIATRVSYHLDFTGPSFSVDTHCSSSLSAIYLAYKSIVNGEAKAAIAGGVNLSLHPNKYQHVKDFLSSSGKCRSFGAGGDGYVPGEGVGAILLKPLKDAIEMNDYIYGVIHNAAMEHSGRTAGVKVPNPKSQADLIVHAYDKAGINPETVSYVEAHGTGTELGDPIEIEGLNTAFEHYTKNKQFCSIGSVKSNIGHLEAAAGISQITKVLLQLRYKKLVPSLHSENINENIDFSNTPFFLQKNLSDWIHNPLGKYNRRAAVSSFGAGGVNCCCIIEEFPNKYLKKGISKNKALIPFSAKTKTALMDYIKEFHNYLMYEEIYIPLDNIAFTMQVGREYFEHRAAFIASDLNELVHLFDLFIKGQYSSHIVTGESVREYSQNEEIYEQAYSWVKGEQQNWTQIYSYQNMKRVPLPTYPFEKETHWAPSSKKGLQAATLFLTHNKNSFSSLVNNHLICYKQYWGLNESYCKGNINRKLIVFDNEMKIHKYLDNRGYDTIGVKKGNEFITVSENEFALDINSKDHYIKLWKEIQISEFDELQLLCMLDYKAEVDKNIDSDNAIISFFLALCSSLNKYALKHKVKINYIYRTTETIKDIYSAATIGFFKSISLENCNFLFKLIGINDNTDMLEIIERELSIANNYTEILKYENNKRYSYYYEPLKESETLENMIRHGGTYIITGGVKGVGYHISTYLASAMKANLVLVGRSKLDSKIESLIRILEKQGGSILYLQADVTNMAEVETIFKKAKATYGSINGIIHSAGIINDSYMIQKEMDDFKTVTSPKIEGTIILDECSKDENLDFFVMFSSLTSIIGNVGQCDYSYANSFLDNYAAYRQNLRNLEKRHGRSISINWPYWEDGGMKIHETKKEILFEQTGLVGLDTQSGVEAFIKAINSNYSNVAVLVGNQDKLCTAVLNGQVKSQLYEKDEYSEIKEEIESFDSNIDLFKCASDLIKKSISEVSLISIDKIGVFDRVEELGLDSIMIERLILNFEKYLGKLPSTLFFEYENIAQLAEYLSTEYKTALEKYSKNKRNFSQSIEREKMENVSSIFLKNDKEKEFYKVTTERKNEYLINDIAIVGVEGKYPGAENLDELWENLEQGVDCVTDIPKERWDWKEYYDEDIKKSKKGKIYCKWGGFIKDVECFDNALFNISPREAALMDPQERLFLENVWNLLENSGYSRENLKRKFPKDKGADIGVFVGVTTSDYRLLSTTVKEGEEHIIPNSNFWSIPNRVSFFFDFNGPSIAIDTACSSSLVAVHAACESIKRNECKMAIAGGVNLYFHPSKYLAMCQLGMLSKTGKCHAFGAEADGFVPGEGIGSILLKPVNMALEDGDYIWGVIKGTAVNHGGRTNGFKVPNPQTQAKVVSTALENAGISPEKIHYIEAHGTGTSLGDPIEIEGLFQAFKSLNIRKQRCPIGSIKTNIGHLEAAAGISGLTKVLLQMKNKMLVPSLHAEELNRHINFEDAPFYVQRERAEWKTENPNEPLRAGISSFGAGGVNAHIIIEEFIAEEKGRSEEHE